MDVKTEGHLDVLSGGGKAANPVPDGVFIFAAPGFGELRGVVGTSRWTGDGASREG